MRLKFYLWLFEALKQDPTRVPNKAFKTLRFILFPLNGFYQAQSGIKHSWESDNYTIQGLTISGTMLREIKYRIEKGQKVEIQAHSLLPDRIEFVMN